MQLLKQTLYFVLFIIGLNASAQIVTIVDEEDKTPLEWVEIISENPRSYTYTNFKGQADLTDFQQSTQIEFTQIGYKSITLSYSQIDSMGFQIELNKAAFSLETIVISGNKWKQNSTNIPAKITTISPKDNALLNPQTAADLLGTSGKVFIQKSQQGGGSPMIRGFATNRLLYTVDGVRMNNAIFRSGNIQNVINIDPFSVEHTEVIFGPNSVIYGSDAIGGVMSFQTLIPEFSLKEKPYVFGKATSRYSSANNEKTGHFDVNLGWEKWAAITSFSYWNYDHLRQGSHGPNEYIKPKYVQRQDSTDVVITQEDSLLQIPSAYSQFNLLQKVRFRPNEKWDFNYGFHFSETSPYGRYDRHNRIRNNNLRYADWNYGPQKWLMNNLSINYNAKNKIFDEATLRLAYQEFEESRISRNLNDNDREVRVENVAAYSANLDFTKKIGKKNTLFYGTEFVFNDIKSTGFNQNIQTGISSEGPARYPQSNWTSMAVYVNDLHKVNKQFSIQSGLRYNQFQLNADFDTTFYNFPFTSANINNGALTGSFGFVYKPQKTWVINSNFGTAFRSPNVDDIGKVFDSEPGAVVVPNPNLKAEYAYNIDLGIAKIFGNFLKLDITGYYTLLDNALVNRDFTLNGQDSIIYDGTLSKVRAIQNAAKASVYGVQMGAVLKLVDGFSINTDVNYQKGEEELDDGTISASRHAAPFFGIVRLNYAKKRIKLQLNTQYQAEVAHSNLANSEQSKKEIYALDNNGNTYAPAWYTLNFKALYNINESFMISTGVENITDQRYRPYSSGLSGAGRNFIVAITAKF